MNKVLKKKEFFYMYECLFQDMHVRLLFDDFTMGVLCVLNVVLSQLHPNKWVAIQALQALSLYTYVKVNPIMFLHYFCCRPHKKALWVSLIRISSRPLFWMFTSLYKNFKTSYFKEKPLFDSAGKLYFFFIDNSVLISMTSTPRNI